MPKTVLTISFNGSEYCGWQVQKNAVSVQSTVQDAVECVFGTRLPVTGCSRTDAGVHANAYICHIDGITDIELTKLPLALNMHLPDSISVLKAAIADDTFHARYSATGKEYVYLIHNSRIRSPFYGDRVYRYGKPIDIDKAQACANEFTGEKDFASFMAAHSKIEDTVREVKYFNIEKNGDLISCYIAANGFLYNMARIMVGTLLRVMENSSGKTITQIINEKNRNAAGYTAPANALYLNKVFY